MAAAVLAAVLLVASGAAPASAQDSTPSPSPTAPALSGTVDTTLAPVGNGVVHPGDPLDVWVSLTNGTAYSVGETAVTLAVGGQALTARSALSAWLAGKGQAAGMTTIGSARLDAVASGATAARLVIVPADDPAISSRSPGVYPLRAVFSGPSGTRTATSVMIVPDPSTPVSPVGVIVPITAGPLTSGLLTSEQLAAMTAPDGELTAALDAVDGTDAILAVDPAIPAAIRVLGTAAPPRATAWLDRLLTLTNSRFALQFADADPVAQLASGQTTLLAPTSLQAYMKAEDFPPETNNGSTPAPSGTAPASPTPTPTATTVPGQPVYPDLGTLLGIGAGARDAVYWPFAGTADAAAVGKLGRLPSGDTESVTLVSSAATAGGAGDGAAPAGGKAGAAHVLVYDQDASAAVTTAAEDGADQTRGAPLTAATAYLALATRAAGGAPLLVVVDRPHAASAAALRSAVLAAQRAPGAAATTLDALVGANTEPVTVNGKSADTARVDALGTLSVGEAEISDFSSILADPSLLTGPERAEILQLLGSGWVGDAGWEAARTDHAQATAKTLASVDILPSDTINLAGTGASLRFWVRNDLPWAVNVTMLAHSDDVRLEVQARTPVVAQPQSNTRVELPVSAKIANGDAAIALRLRSPTGVDIGRTHLVDLSVHADWEVVGIVVLGIIVVGFLVLGVVRTVLGRRRRRAAEEAAAEAAEDR